MTDQAARERIVQEHVERELAHDLDALVDTFTSDDGLTVLSQLGVA